MMSNPIHQFLAGMLLLNIIMSTAYGLPSDGSDDVNIKPDDLLYPAKLLVEDITEALTISDHNKLIKKQEHLEERLMELEYEVEYNYNKNTERILQKIQLKQIELEEIEKKASAKLPETIDEVANDVLNGQSQYNTAKRHTTEVLITLLNSDTMPEQSKKGLMNALNHSGIKIVNEEGDDVELDDIKNGTQGSYKIDPVVLSLIPFNSVMLLDPRDEQWYSITRYADSIEVSNTVLLKPDMYLYPTEAQVEQFKSIIEDIEDDNGISVNTNLKLTQLWFEIRKEGGEE